jgi:hypothetical protein
MRTFLMISPFEISEDGAERVAANEPIRRHAPPDLRIGRMGREFLTQILPGIGDV